MTASPAFTSADEAFGISPVTRSTGVRASRVVPSAVLAFLLLGWLVLDQLLLWRFLGFISNSSTVALGLASATVLVVLARQTPTAVGGISGRTLLAAFGVAFMVFLLGGEGRFFYATTDWQVRGAVLRDLTQYPWPYLYDVRPAPTMLRAPIGMYLVPALIGKLGGPFSAELALLLQNSIFFTLLIGLAAPLFSTSGGRWRALVVFFVFSGMDAIGQVLAGQPLWMNAERWVLPVFSAHLSQAFWVPQHALAGWTVAILFLICRERRLPLAALLAAVPLVALWSPFAAIGSLPFVGLAMIETLRRCGLTVQAVLWPALATLLALPGLAYLAAGSGKVGGHLLHVPFNHYVLFELLEVGPYLLALAFAGWRGRFGGALLLVIAATLLLVPFFQIGELGDFTMRASIPALAILALGIGDLLDRREVGGVWPHIATAALMIGAITPALEIWRAVSLPRAPRILCSYYGVVPGGYDTYVIPAAAVPKLIAPRRPVAVRPHDPARCWDGSWPEPALFADGRTA